MSAADEYNAAFEAIDKLRDRFDCHIDRSKLRMALEYLMMAACDNRKVDVKLHCNSYRVKSVMNGL